MRKRSSGTLALARRFLRVRILWLALVVAATAGTTAHAQENDGNDNETEAVYYEPYNQVGGILLTQSSNTENPIKIGFINGGSTFFQPVLEGYRTTCQELDLTCYAAEFSKTNSSVGNKCVFRELTSMKWLQEEGIHGLALKPCTAEYNAFLGNFTAAKVPVIFFDSDVESMKEHRIAYVGTEQRRMGVVMARVLRQQRPEGGTFGITLGKDGRTEGFMEEIMKDNDRDDRAHWYPAEGNDLTVDGSLFNTSSWEQKYSLRMEWFAQRNTTAIVSFRQTPMKIPNWKQVVDKYRDRNITYLGVDAADFQLEYLNQRYVDGLVGQSPWMIGKTVVDVLVKYRREGKVDQDFIPTNLIAYNMIPLELPDLQFEKNLLGNLSWLGISLFIVVAMVATTCITWTLYYQKSSLVVGAAQPFFLVTIAAGVLIMSASLIPLSFDDGGDINSLSDREKVFRCMTIPWLSFTGFSVVFSALFAKTLRINKLMASSNSFARVQVDVKDVMGVFSLIMFCNVLVLTLWTVIDPLMYTRSWNDGTDYWNREFSSSGSCSCDRPGAYLTPLAIINCAAVGVSVWQAIKARHMTSEFSESKYIGLTVFSMAQGFVTGIPVTAVVKDIPNAFYMVLTFLIFILCMVILMLIFLPKMVMQRKYAGLSKGEQKKLMSLAISVGQKSSQHFSTGQKGSPRDFGGKNSQWSSKPFDIPVSPHARESSQYVSELTNPVNGIKSNFSRELLEQESILRKSATSVECVSSHQMYSGKGEDGDEATELFRRLLALSKDEEGEYGLRNFIARVDITKLSPAEKEALEGMDRVLEAKESAR